MGIEVEQRMLQAALDRRQWLMERALQAPQTQDVSLEAQSCSRLNHPWDIARGFTVQYMHFTITFTRWILFAHTWQRCQKALTFYTLQ